MDNSINDIWFREFKIFPLQKKQKKNQISYVKETMEKLRRLGASRHVGWTRDIHFSIIRLPRSFVSVLQYGIQFRPRFLRASKSCAFVKKNAK